MIDRALELTTKLVLGEYLSEEDKEYLRNRNTKYELVRYLVIEHSRLSNKPDLANFRFTPGDNFDNQSTLDVANAIINIDLSKAKPVKFGDLRLEQ